MSGIHSSVVEAAFPNEKNRISLERQASESSSVEAPAGETGIENTKYSDQVAETKTIDINSAQGKANTCDDSKNNSLIRTNGAGDSSNSTTKANTDGDSKDQGLTNMNQASNSFSACSTRKQDDNSVSVSSGQQRQGNYRSKDSDADTKSYCCSSDGCEDRSNSKAGWTASGECTQFQTGEPKVSATQSTLECGSFDTKTNDQTIDNQSGTSAGTKCSSGQCSEN